MDINNIIMHKNISSIINGLIILAVAIVCIRLTYKAKADVNNGKVNNNAQYVVSIGVLGTFVGILFGLRGFETGDSKTIAASINVFLDGMRLAFVTSVIGMGCSLYIKRCQGEFGGEAV